LLLPQGWMSRRLITHQLMMRVTTTRASTSSIVGSRSLASFANTLIALKNRVPTNMWRIPGVSRCQSGKRAGTPRVLSANAPGATW